MNWPSLEDFREVRRGLPVLAAILFAASLFFPMWEILVDAVQYPETTLRVQLYAYPRIAGDYVEMAALNHYVGFNYPDPVLIEPNFEVKEAAIDVPEWSLGPLAFLGVAATGAFVAVAPTIEKLKRGLKWQFRGTIAVFTIMLADIQVRLWQAGHSLDPDAPLTGVEGFTPPIWGKYQVANITSVSRFATGGYMAMLAIALLVIAYYYRNSETTVDELPGHLAARVRGLRDRVRGADGGE